MSSHESPSAGAQTTKAAAVAVAEATTPAVEKKEEKDEERKEMGEDKKDAKKKSEESERPCSTQNCPNMAKLMCPKCIQLKLTPACFCNQDCFKKGWKKHTDVHAIALANNAYKFTGSLRPAYISPMRIVPPHIPRPDYADHPEGEPQEERSAKKRDEIPIYTKEEIAGIREACRIGREVLDIAARHAIPGVTTDEIDRIVHEATIARNAYPSPLNYRGFPKSCCTSVNEIICHGIPDARPLVAGDIINIDITAYYKGFHGDLNETYTVGECNEESKKLIKTTHDSLMEAIKQGCKAGTMCRDFGTIISRIVEKEKYSVVRSYCGHGIGRMFHCNPNIPHYARNKAVGVLKPGMVFTIEPMINMGVWEDITWPDDWTSSTKDGKRSAQFEHTILITDNGYDILTARTNKSRPLWWEEKEGEEGKWMNEDISNASKKKKKKNKKKKKSAGANNEGGEQGSEEQNEEGGSDEEAD